MTSEFDTVVPVEYDDPNDMPPAELDGFGFGDEQNDADEEKKARRDMQAPAGWYAAVGGGFKPKRADRDDGQPGVRYFGKVTKETEVELEDGKTYTPTPYVGFRLSHKDVRKGTKPDFAYGLYLKAKDAYKATNKIDREANVPAEEVYRFVRDYPIRLRLTPGSDSPLVVEIRQVRGEEAA